MQILAIVVAAIVVAIHVACTVAVAGDARKVLAAQQELWPFGRAQWIAATLVFGLVAATCYWVVHMSRVTRVDRLAIDPEPVRTRAKGEEPAQLNPELQRIQDRLTKHDDE